MIHKMVKKLVLKAIDKTIGQKYPAIDRLTDIFQEQEVIARDLKNLKIKVEALESLLIEKGK